MRGGGEKYCQTSRCRGARVGWGHPLLVSAHGAVAARSRRIAGGRPAWARAPCRVRLQGGVGRVVDSAVGSGAAIPRPAARGTRRCQSPPWRGRPGKPCRPPRAMRPPRRPACRSTARSAAPQGRWRRCRRCPRPPQAVAGTCRTPASPGRRTTSLAEEVPVPGAADSRRGTRRSADAILRISAGGRRRHRTRREQQLHRSPRCRRNGLGAAEHPGRRRRRRDFAREQQRRRRQRCRRRRQPTRKRTPPNHRQQAGAAASGAAAPASAGSIAAPRRGP